MFLPRCCYACAVWTFDFPSELASPQLPFSTIDARFCPRISQENRPSQSGGRSSTKTASSNLTFSIWRWLMINYWWNMPLWKQPLLHCTVLPNESPPPLVNKKLFACVCCFLLLYKSCCTSVAIVLPWHVFLRICLLRWPGVLHSIVFPIVASVANARLVAPASVFFCCESVHDLFCPSFASGPSSSSSERGATLTTHCFSSPHAYNCFLYCIQRWRVGSWKKNSDWVSDVRFGHLFVESYFLSCLHFYMSFIYMVWIRERLMFQRLVLQHWVQL